MDTRDRLGDVLYRWRIRVVLPHVTGSLLDIGCGTNQLVRAYGSGIGVDLHQFGGADLIVEDSAHLPFDENAFDTVAILAALNHIPNRSEVLREVWRVLKPDGTVLVTMIPPRISRVWHFVRRHSDRDQVERAWVPGEVYGLTASDTRRLLEDAGFRRVRQRRFMCGVNTLTLGAK